MIFCHIRLCGDRQNVRCRATVSYFGVDKRDGKFFDSSIYEMLCVYANNENLIYNGREFNDGESITTD